MTRRTWLAALAAAVTALVVPAKAGDDMGPLVYGETDFPFGDHVDPEITAVAVGLWDANLPGQYDLYVWVSIKGMPETSYQVTADLWTDSPLNSPTPDGIWIPYGLDDPVVTSAAAPGHLYGTATVLFRMNNLNPPATAWSIHARLWNAAGCQLYDHEAVELKVE